MSAFESFRFDFNTLRLAGDSNTAILNILNPTSCYMNIFTFLHSENDQNKKRVIVVETYRKRGIDRNRRFDDIVGARGFSVRITLPTGRTVHTDFQR